MHEKVKICYCFWSVFRIFKNWTSIREPHPVFSEIKGSPSNFTLILSEFKRINSDDCEGNRSKINTLSFFNIRSEIWRQPPT